MCRRASVHVCMCLHYNVVHVRESLSILLLLSDYLHPLAFNSGQPFGISRGSQKLPHTFGSVLRGKGKQSPTHSFASVTTELATDLLGQNTYLFPRKKNYEDGKTVGNSNNFSFFFSLLPPTAPPTAGRTNRGRFRTEN